MSTRKSITGVLVAPTKWTYVLQNFGLQSKLQNRVHICEIFHIMSNKCRKNWPSWKLLQTKHLKGTFFPRKHYSLCVRFRVPCVLSASEFIQSNIFHYEISASNWEKQCSRCNPVTPHRTHYGDWRQKYEKRSVRIVCALIPREAGNPDEGFERQCLQGKPTQSGLQAS